MKNQNMARHKAAQCLMKENKRSDGIGMRRGVVARAAAGGSRGCKRRGHNVSQPRILATEDFRVAVLLEYIELATGFARIVATRTPYRTAIDLYLRQSAYLTVCLPSPTA